MVQFDLLPPPLGIPSSLPDLHFFSFHGGLFPTPELLMDLMYIFFGTSFLAGSIFISVQKQTILFDNFYKRFLAINERKKIQHLPRFLKTGLAKNQLILLLVN